MKLIVGLGNPGAQYQATRHNVGFCLVDLLANRWSIDLKRQKHDALFGQGHYRGDSAILLKPQTYMNRSGQSVLQAVKFYKIDQKDFLVVVDDMDLELGRLRLRSQGGAGGHNGLLDIIEKLGTNDFSRLRIGIGSARGAQAVSHVLGNFSDDEIAWVAQALERSAEALECWMAKGISVAMNRFNSQSGSAENDKIEKS
jgi:PTH1 family peptidyl-tRNA hydrolase